MKIPIDVLPYFKPLNEKLISFIGSLAKDDWNKQTVASKWKVKDVVAHLLDGNIRRISLHRDGHQFSPDEPVNSYPELVDYLNRLNAEWVKAMKRMSPELIVEWLEITNKEVYKIFKGWKPFEKAIFPVSWAGEVNSQNWFDLAREYTERWIHQQQIRDAFNDKELIKKKFYKPLLDTFMIALPYTFRNVDASEGTSVAVHVGELGPWVIRREQNGWKASDKKMISQNAIMIDPDFAWKLFSKSKRPSDANGNVEMKGDKELVSNALHLVSVMA